MALEPAARSALSEMIDAIDGRGFRSPELMVIGDNALNGMSSATLDGRRAAAAPPVLAAAAAGLPIRPVTLPRAVLADMEQACRDLAAGALNVAGFRERILGDLALWEADLAGPKAEGPAWFDVLAISGAAVVDLTDAASGSAGGARRMLAGAAKRFRAAAGLPGDELVEIHMGVETVHTLNPRGLAELDGLTQVDHVDLRRPKRLVIGVGQNDGLVSAIMAGKRIDVFDRRLARLPEAMRRLGEALAPGLEETQRVVLLGLPRPGLVANLRPKTLHPDEQDPGRDPKARDHWRRYVGFLAMRGDMTGREVVEFDAHAAEIWRKAVEAFRGAIGRVADRVIEVDPAAVLAPYDQKHGGEGLPVDVGGRRLALGNLILDPETPGLYGIDNLNLNGAGQALIARALADALVPGTGDAVDIDAAARAEPLLHDAPPLLNPAAFLISLLSPFVTFERI